MNEDDQKIEPAILDYQVPTEKKDNPLAGAIVLLLGIVAGLFGALMLLYGIPGIFWVFMYSPTRDFAGDLFVMVMLLLIGFLCEYVSIRWCRSAYKMFKRA